MKTIVLSPAAARDFDALPNDAQVRIGAALADYAISGRGDVKKLSGQPLYRLRVGRYRVIFDENRTTIVAIYIGKRDTTTYRRN